MHGDHRWIRGLVIALAAAGAARAEDADRQAAEEARRLLEAGLRALGAAVPGRVNVEAGQQAAQRQQQEAHIQQQAQQMQQMLQPLLHAELEALRHACGSLAAADRRTIRVAGEAAVKVAARKFAEGQFVPHQRRNQQPQRFDPRAAIQEGLAAAAKPLAKAEEFAVYEQERVARQARRARTARLRILAKLDTHLDLSAAQRQAIEADLEKRWEADWLRELDDQGNVRVNDLPLAPDFAQAAIAPHLDERRRAAWKTWCKEAGWSRFQHHHFGWNFDGVGMQPDPWWK